MFYITFCLCLQTSSSIVGEFSEDSNRMDDSPSLVDPTPMAGSSGVANRKRKVTATPDFENRNALYQRALDVLSETTAPSDECQVFANFVASQLRKLKNPVVAERKIQTILWDCIDAESAARIESEMQPPLQSAKVADDTLQSAPMETESVTFNILGEDGTPYNKAQHKSFRFVAEDGNEADPSLHNELAVLYGLKCMNESPKANASEMHRRSGRNQHKQP